MTTRMTVHRLDRLILAGDVESVATAVSEAPRLLGQSIEHDGQDGWTPLHLAVAEGATEIVRLLSAAGADLTAETERRRTPLHLALQLAPELVPVLVELGVVLDAASAAYLDDVERLSQELDGGAPLHEGSTGVDLLSWAAFGGAARTARLLLDRGADADRGALHAAAQGSRPELVQLLLDAGADVHRREPGTGRTALHTAVAAGPDGQTAEIVTTLLAAGADVDATTNDGASALDISQVAAARSRRIDAVAATGNDALADLLSAHAAAN